MGELRYAWIAVLVAAVTAGGCSVERPKSLGGGSVWTAPASAQPCADGATRECHVDLGVHDGVRTCFAGKQDCRAGSWSECLGDDVTLTSIKLHASSGLQTKSLSDAAATPCASPCDPSCVGFDEAPDGGLSPTADASDGGGSGGGSWLGYAGGSPPGFFAKLVCDGAGYDCNTGGSYACTGQTHCTRYSACEDDFHCDPSGACAPPKAGWTWPKSVCPSGPDLTVGASCKDASGKEGFTLCNRGNDALTNRTVGFWLRDGNNFAWPCPDGTCAKNPVTCTYTLAADLQPGTCVRISEDAPCFDKNWGNGNTTAEVNPDQAITECGSGATPATSPGCADNWADIKKGGAACSSISTITVAPVTYSFSYDGVCPAGKHVQWSKLAFEAITPCGAGGCASGGYSSVKFEAQTEPALAGGGFGAPIPATPALVAQAPRPPFGQDASCTMTGPLPQCPADLFVALGGTTLATTSPRLTLRITLIPSADGSALPALKSWKITYSCKDSE
jgi:hypothetical protein